MRVLHVCPYMHPAAGGPPLVVKRLASLAPVHCWDARVLTTSQFCSDDGRSLAATLDKCIDVVVLPQDRPRLLGFSSKAVQAVEAGVRAANIVHLHTLWHPLNTMCRRACARFGRPYVLMPHGMLDPYSLSVKALRKKLYLSLREGHNLRAAARIVYTTPLEERLARKSLAWLGPGEVIPLGADMPPELPREQLGDLFFDAFPQAVGRRCLIFLGRLHPKKGLERVIAALPQVIAHFPKVLLIVAGTGKSAYVSELRELVGRKGLDGHVLFTGMLQGEQKWGAFAASEAFVLPSHQENFAIAVVEAMHMSLPVVITNKVNIWPYIAEARAGVVLGDANDNKLDATLIEMLHDPSSASEKGTRGRVLAQKHFRWEATVRRVTELYQRLLA